MADLNYAAILAAGQSLVPDFRQQQAQDLQNRVQQAQASAAIQNARTQQQRKQSFADELEAAMATHNPADIQRLMMKYPEFADQLKPGWEAMREDDRRTALTQIGGAYTRGLNGDYSGAAKIIRRRYDADMRAGTADQDTKDILDALESGDPEQQKMAIGTLGVMASSADPSKFAETYKAFNPTDRTTNVQREYEWRVQQFGKPSADAWLSVEDTKLLPVQKGGDVYRLGVPSSGTQVSGEFSQSDPRAGVPAPTLGQDGNPTVLTPEQFRATAKALGQEKTIAWQQRNGVPVQVRTLQEANSLPVGTLYITPDGRKFKR